MFRQNQITIMLIAFGLVFLVAGWLFRIELGETQNWISIIGICIIGIFYHRFARNFARQMILGRRRFYKELWRREKNETGNIPLELYEEEMVVLLGRIKSQAFVVYFMAFVSFIALYYGSNTFSYVMALGILFLPVRLHLMVRSLATAIPDDLENSQLTNHFESVIRSDAACFLLRLNIRNIHDFILPTSALPFWNLREVEQWLRDVGFEQTLGGNWTGNRANLKLLEYNEVMEIEPCEEKVVSG